MKLWIKCTEVFIFVLSCNKSCKESNKLLEVNNILTSVCVHVLLKKSFRCKWKQLFILKGGGLYLWYLRRVSKGFERGPTALKSKTLITEQHFILKHD